jgi:cytochrome c551/c552
VWLLMFLSLAAAITGAGLLFFQQKRNAPGAGADAESIMGQKTGIRLTTVALLITPLFILLTLVRLPDSAVSGWVYALAALAVLFLFAALHALYACVRLGKWSSSAYLFAAVVLATTALVTRDQVVLHNVTRDHAAVLAQEYDRSEEELRSALGVMAKQLTGEDIYNAKCSACHLFDQKKVGPSYRTVVPKYRENKAGLVAFILNPVKVDAAYPPMPSQGLKPSEADSIATYLLKQLEAKGS